MKIGFIGLGKLGLECAEVFAEKYTVRGYDIYPRESRSIKVCSLEETILESDWIFIAVPTPHETGYDGSTPSSHLPPRDFGHTEVVASLSRIQTLCGHNNPKKIVLISTVLPGTTRKYFADLLGPHHTFLYNPYLIAMGSVKWDMVNPEMVMIGSKNSDDPSIQELIEIYKPLMQNNPRYVTGTWEECESIKIFYNTFISTKIGLANMIQDFAMRIGNIDVDVVTDALANSTMRIMGLKYMTAGMGDAGACHPRDNIALRWLAQEYNLGYDIFDTVMQAREQQAKNLADFIVQQATLNKLPIVIHGKSYKPDVPYCIGSYSTLVGHYIKQHGMSVKYVDPLADDSEDVLDIVDYPCVFLWAHNRKITYGYTGNQTNIKSYCDILSGSVIVDPWRELSFDSPHIKVIHYGNSRS